MQHNGGGSVVGAWPRLESHLEQHPTQHISTPPATIIFDLFMLFMSFISSVKVIELCRSNF